MVSSRRMARVQAVRAAVEKYGVGPAAVRTIAGTMDLHVKLEQRLAQFKGVEAAITFQSGFTANLATIECLEKGLMRSATIMVPCPWFPEAVRMLKENPGLDVVLIEGGEPASGASGRNGGFVAASITILQQEP